MPGRSAKRLALAVTLLLACPRPTTTAPPPAGPTVAAPAPPPDPCADAAIPPDTEAALHRVAELRRCGRGLAALPIYAELLQRDPRSRWAYELAALAIAEGDPAQARALLQDSPAARVGLALLHVDAHESLGDPADREAARTSFQAALAVAPDDPYALSVALRHYLALADREPARLALAAQLCRERVLDDGDPDGAPAGGPERLGAPAAAIEPGLTPAPAPDRHGAALLAATCGRVALTVQEPGEARRRFALALALDPADPSPRLTWAAAELAAGNDRKAAELYAAAVDAPAAGDRYLARLGLGVARERLHDHAGAALAYRSAAAVRGWRSGDPPERLPPELQYNLGAALAAAGDPRRSAEARALLRAYADRPGADELRRLRCRQLLLELSP